MPQPDPTNASEIGLRAPKPPRDSGRAARRALAALAGAVLLHLGLGLAAPETVGDWSPESALVRWLRKVDEHPVRAGLALFLALQALAGPGNRVRVESDDRNG